MPPEKTRFLYQALQERNEAIQTIKSQAVVGYRSQLFRSKSVLTVLAGRPLNVRLDSLSEFGFFENQIFLDRGRLSILWHPENQYFQGAGTEEQLEKFLGIPLSPQALVDLLLNRPSLEKRGECTVRYYPKEKVYLFSNPRHEYWVKEENKTAYPVLIRLFDLEGATLYRVTYSDYRLVDGLWFPFHIEGNFNGKRVVLQYEEIVLNETLDQKLFEAEIPENATRIFD